MAQTVADALSAAHEVTVVCGRPSYDPTERRSWQLWQTERASGAPKARTVKIIRVGSTDYSRAHMRRRVLDYLTYAALSVPRAGVERCGVGLGVAGPAVEGVVAAFVARCEGK